jgi:hypothetical protein
MQVKSCRLSMPMRIACILAAFGIFVGLALFLHLTGHNSLRDAAVFAGFIVLITVFVVKTQRENARWLRLFVLGFVLIGYLFDGLRWATGYRTMRVGLSNEWRFSHYSMGITNVSIEEWGEFGCISVRYVRPREKTDQPTHCCIAY